MDAPSVPYPIRTDVASMLRIVTTSLGSAEFRLANVLHLTIAA